MNKASEKVEEHKYKHVGEFIREKRCETGLTIRQLAEVTEINATRITRVELGQKSILDLSLNQIAKLANTLSVSVTDLASLAEETESSRLAMLENGNFRYIGEFIRQWRVQHNYTTRELAEEIGCSASRIAKIEAGERSILHLDIREFAELANIMNISMERLLNLSEKTEKARAEMHEAKKKALAEARKSSKANK